ncbi:DUF2760 domain-containing protein [Novipirellula artificiosorum]|uniref:DUF2760 domain-containing protein n=1 Tax=Novipirellula artificiosorum TaxID=2528016 RepID=A0A5C6DKI4_9BACT|nr:DUF2760 domain-containing protein [Novipirellula artificiosorum]TWU37370.1 hypothetical protein Poly41_35000 [Novipirellula artificiosorum]
MGIGIAFRAFSAALFNKQAAENIRRALEQGSAETAEPKLPAPKPVESVVAKPAKPARSEAITLLSALQRESRLIDLIQEDLGKYSDAQVGAAARPCLLQCASTLSRFFDLKPVSDAGEGATVEVAADESPARYQWIGEGNLNSGKLVHQGWQATRVELPEWTGSDTDANIVAPAQVQR